MGSNPDASLVSWPVLLSLSESSLLLTHRDRVHLGPIGQSLAPSKEKGAPAGFSHHPAARFHQSLISSHQPSPLPAPMQPVGTAPEQGKGESDSCHRGIFALCSWMERFSARFPWGEGVESAGRLLYVSIP